MKCLLKISIIVILAASIICNVIQWRLSHNKLPTTPIISDQNTVSPVKIPVDSSGKFDYSGIIAELNRYRTNAFMTHSTNTGIWVGLVDRWCVVKISNPVKMNLVRISYSIYGDIGAGYYRKIFDNFPLFIGGDLSGNPGSKSLNVSASLLYEW